MTALSRKATLTLGALMTFLAPRLAQDARLDLTPLVDGLTTENFGSKKSTIVTAITERTAGKLAQDAKLDLLPALLDVLEKQPVVEDKPATAEPGISQQAMDQAIAATVESTAKRVRGEMRAIEAAREEVRPYVGQLALACDSAEEVYRAALGILKVDVKDVPAAALPHILKAQTVPGSKPGPKVPHLALDSAATKSFAERFPDAARLSA